MRLALARPQPHHLTIDGETYCGGGPMLLTRWDMCARHDAGWLWRLFGMVIGE